MRVTLNWLREFVAIDVDTKTLCERLTMGGLEVEAVEEIGADIEGVLVAEIASIERHPGADRLSLCQVASGADQTTAVVCGARNMKAGDRVAFAPAGTVLPGGRRIERSVIRDVESNGMLCSEAELGLSGASEGILILPADATLGERLVTALDIADTVLEIAVTPNRGDCLSILGIAREIAALTGTRLRRLRHSVREHGVPASPTVAIRIEDPAGCARYAARLLRGGHAAESPRWMRNRLAAVGLRSINVIVDVTNYVMMERGQPLHAFDYDKLPRPEIVVRRAGATAEIRTLDGETRRLGADDLLITTGEEPIAIAGVMGGESTEVSDTTSNVLIESAWFDPVSVRRTAKRLGLHSEASYRFERGVDICGVPAALERAAALLAELTEAQVAPGVIDLHPGLRPRAPIHVRGKRVGQLLGLPVSRSEIATALKRLGADVSSGPHGALAVVPPSFRSDLGREEDVIEEVARSIGYDRIPPTMPGGGSGGFLPARLLRTRELRRLLAAFGLCEAVSVSFSSPGMNEQFAGVGVPGRPVILRNPVNQEEGELRRSLLGGLVAAWKLNRSQGAGAVALFEVGKVFWRDEDYGEAWRLAGVLAGERPWLGTGEVGAVAFADAKGVVEAVLESLRLDRRVTWAPLDDDAAFHPGKSAALGIEGERIGVVGALHPDAEVFLGVSGPHWLFELDLDRLLAYVTGAVFFRELPRYPAIVRDLALIADEGFMSEGVVRFVREQGGVLVEDVRLFDQYAGDPIPSGRKGLAYSISYRAADRTLTDLEVNGVHGALTAALVRALPVELR